MNKKRIISCVLIVASAALAVAALIILPDSVITQISLTGSGATTMPKAIAVLIPAALGIGGGLAALASQNSSSSLDKSMFVSLVGILIFVIMFIANR